MENFMENRTNFIDNIENQLSSNYGVIQNSSQLSILLTKEAILTTWWSIFDENYMRHSSELTVILVVAYMLIFVAGVTGNIMVILVVYLRPKMRSVTNVFIMNLAVADLFVIVFCVPATLMSNVFAPWILGSFMCKGVAYVQGVSVCASAYSLAAISLDRCKAIYKSHGRSNGLTEDQASYVIFIIWVTAILLTIPWAVIFEVAYPQDNGIPYCMELWSNELVGKMYFLFTNFFIGFCFPLILISISNMIIWRHVNNRKVPHDSDSSGFIKRMHRKARHGVLKMLGVVTLVFLFSWLPLYVLVMRVKFGKDITDSEYNIHGTLMPFAQWLGSWSSSINPILYAFLNKKYREMFKSLLPSWLPFARKRSKKFNTRGVVTNGSYEQKFRRKPLRKLVSKVKSSKTLDNCSKTILLQRQFSKSFSAPSICIIWSIKTKDEANQEEYKLRKSAERIPESKSLPAGISIINCHANLLFAKGRVTKL